MKQETPASAGVFICPPPSDKVDDGGMFDGKEPARGDYDNERDYRDAHDSWKDGRG